MLRSVLELTYPVVTFISGDVSPESRYCHISGFFTAFLFEASDLMVFIIAIHTTVYVFNPQPFEGGGLWRWRYYIFFAWFTIPGLLAGLAFINPTAYVPLVTLCYLPAHPVVWRYALAWGPRYFILLTISVLYVALYAYVRHVYRTIDQGQRHNASSSEINSQPSLSNASHRTLRHDLSQHPTYPEPVYFQRKQLSIQQPQNLENDSNSSMDTSSNQTHSPTSESRITQHSPLSFNSRSTPRITTTTATRNMFLTTLTQALPPSVRNPPLTPRDATLTFDQRRARVERQIRNLFLFPIIYFIMWIPPFINNIYQEITYDSNAKSLPTGTFVVSVLATIFLTSQGFINVCVYAVGERPWRKCRRLSQPSSLPLSLSGTFIDTRVSHNEKLDDDSLMVVIQAQIDQAKMDHNKMTNTVQAAYARRDIERGERELARANQISDSRPHRSNWWDAQDDVERSVS